MASAPTANEIKTQLRTLLLPVVGTGVNGKAKIFDYMALAFKPGELEDPALLRSTLDPVTLASNRQVSRVNCLMISEAGFSQGPPDSDSTRHITVAGARNLITRQFRLTYFYQFGVASETAFSANIELIRAAINQAPKLGFDTVTDGLAGQGAYIHSHDGLQMPAMLPDAFGDTIVHVGEGILTVRVIEPRGQV